MKKKAILLGLIIYGVSFPCETYQCDSITIREIYMALGGDSNVDVSSWFPTKERITRISFSCNEDTFPSQIGELTALKQLSFTNTKLKYLPRSIGNLTNLEYLDLSDNLLEELPNEIGNLRKLKELDLRRNNLRTLPDSIVNLTSIEPYIDVHDKWFLYIENNYLCTLPEPVARWADKYYPRWACIQKEFCEACTSTAVRQPQLGPVKREGNVSPSPAYFDLRGRRIHLDAAGMPGERSLRGCVIVRSGSGNVKSVRVMVK